jgi:non-specific serine/threonine protein kinase/serine/threonine-protein kinase
MDSITPDLWRRVKEVAAAAWDHEESTRQAYVDRACADDPGLRREVLSLLTSAAAATPYFETPAGGAPATVFSAGSRIGPYRLIRELATGGMGSVYLAERDDGQFQQRVAIKVVRGGFANSFLLQRFREERGILASLEHPNVARLLDGGATETGLPFVAMEFIEGQPIDVFCRTRRLSMPERLAVFRQVCAAVQYAHQHLVIHRDIKSANILVTDDGTPKLLDFGIAKLLDPDTGLEFSTHTTVRVMTPESASPEQLAGKPLTVAADVYALGVLLYRLLTDQSPYRGALEQDTELVRAVCEQVPAPPSELPAVTGARIPRDVDTIVMKALRKEPERRYGSAGQLSEDIQRFLEGRPVEASPDSFRYRTGKFLSRHRVAVPAVAAIVVAIVLGIAATLWQARLAQRERARADAERASAVRQFNAVRGLARSVLGELHDAVESLPGSTPAQEILLRRGTEYLDALYTEAQNDVSLRREIAQGYIRLASVQGKSGLPNLGDRQSARRNLTKAITLLESVAGPTRGDLRDRLELAQSYAGIANGEADETVHDALLAKSRAVLDGLSVDERKTDIALSVRQSVWTIVAQQHIHARDYAGAKAAYSQVRDAAEEVVRLRPASLNADRNLSLAYKQLGAVLEMLNARPEAMQLYEKALELDRRRVAAEPARSLWRLDLSFAYGAIGAALMATGDLPGALARYEEAVRLRRNVVAEDPAEDFAKVSLARGYDRLAIIRGRMGEVAASFDYTRQRISVYRDRLDAHPERENVWREYAQAAFSAAGACLDLLESPGTPPRIARARAADVAAILDQLTATRERWTREKHAGALPPSDDDLGRARERLRKVGRRS